MPLSSFQRVAEAIELNRSEGPIFVDLKPFVHGSGSVGSTALLYVGCEIDSGYFDVPQKLATFFASKAGVGAELLSEHHYFCAGGIMRTVVIGQTDDEDGWALRLEVSMYEERRRPLRRSVQVILLGGRGIDAVELCQRSEAAALDETIDQILDAVREHTGFNPVRLLALRNAIAEHIDGQALLAVWDAKACQERLDALTAPVENTGRRRPSL